MSHDNITKEKVIEDFRTDNIVYHSNSILVL